MPALLQFMPDGLVRASGLARGDSHGKQRCNDSEITEAIDQETVTFAERGDYDSGDGGPEKSSHIHHGRIQRNGVAQVSAILNHLNDEGLASRHVEGIDDALSQPQPDYFADGNDSGQSESGQCEGLQHRENLSYHEGLMAVPAIHPHTGEWPQKKTWYPRCEAHDAQKPRRAGYSIDEPTRGDLRHPSADERYRLAGEEQAIVPRAQRPESKLPAFTLGTRSCCWAAGM